jgi:hypothetical protein
MTGRVPAPRVPGDLTAAQYAALALIAHQRTCRECGSDRSDSRCSLGERYLAATNTSNNDLPGYLTGQ